MAQGKPVGRDILRCPAERRVLHVDSARAGRAWLTIVMLVLIAGAIGSGVYRMTARQEDRQHAEAVQQVWTCPMHPSVIRPEPGKCPICGMDLVPVEQAKPKAESKVAGHGVVQISPEQERLIGVVTTRAERRKLENVVRTVGRVVVDEERLSDVHTKVEGWVEKLYANQTGKIVHRGQPLLAIYSPELVSTQEEYLVALRARDRVKDSPFAEVRRSGESLAAATRKRLKLWDVSESEIEQLEKTGKVKRTLTVYAPATGYIMEKMVVEGMRVMPEMALYRLADLSRVWVEADVYEYQAQLVEVGQEGKLTMASYPGRVFSGRVSYIYPMVEAMTRTLKARLEFENAALALKPGMYADVVIEVAAGEALAVPEDAVLDSGTRKIVFVKEGEGTFVPREIAVGERAAGYYAVLAGLQEGEEVVSSPSFLIDSESRLQAAIQQQAGGAGVGHAGHGQ